MAHYDQNGQHPATYNQYPPQQQQQYTDHDDYNPYNTNNTYEYQQQEYNTYNQQGRYDYHDNPYGGGYTDDPTGRPVSKEQRSERSVFEHDDFSAPRARGPK